MASSRNHKKKDSRKRPQVITPPIRSGQCPSLWEMDEYTFQDMCCALFEQEETVRTCSVYGTRGQKQFGIDLLAKNRTQGEHSVAQCKCYQDFPPTDMQKASEEFLVHWDEKWSKEHVTRFVLMLTCHASSTKQQDEIRTQEAAFREKGVTYEVWSLQTICNRLRPHRGIVSQYLNAEWTDRLCGPPLPAEQTAVAAPSLVNDILANQLQQSWSVISRDTSEQLDAMREAFRGGDIQQALDWIAAAKRDVGRWPGLTPDIQAKILRFEASLCLEMGELDAARTLAAKARSLIPGFDDTVLRALLALHENGPECALKEVRDDAADIDSLNLKAVLLLEVGDIEACKVLFRTHKHVFGNNPESVRLQAVLLRIEGDLQGAAEKIREAREKKPTWVAIRFAEALIEFERSLAPNVLPREFCPSFRIIDWPLVRRDDSSLQQIRSAALTFDELVSSSAHSPQQKQFLEGWKLTCLACDFERQQEADAYCKELLTANPEHPVAIMWSLGRSYARDALINPTTHLESLLKRKSATPDHIVRLVMCLAAQAKMSRALTVLRKTKGLFRKAGARTTWLTWMVQCLASNEQSHDALQLLKDIPDIALRSRLRGVILKGVSSLVGARKEAIEHFLNCYEETGCGEFLFAACSTMAQEGLWRRICDHVELLIASVGTSESIRLCAIALFNIAEYRRVLDLIETHKDVFPSEKPTYDLRTIQVQCRIHLGQINEAVADARILYGQDPSTWNLCLYVDTLSRKGDFATLEGLARNIASDGSLPADTTLFICDHIKSRTPELARELLQRALQADLPDNLVAPALQQAFGLGLEAEVAPLFARMPQLAAEPQSGFQAFRIEDIAQMMKDEARAREEADAAYRKADLPIHLLAERFGPNLAVFYHTNLRLNQRNESTPATILLARHGGMPVADDLSDQKPPWRLNADLSALILAHHVGLLEIVAKTFGPLRISSRTIPALKKMREDLMPPQPTRLDAHRVILRLVGSDRIRIRDSSIISEGPDIQCLLCQYPDDWVSLFDQMQREAGFLVDFLPPTGRDMLGQRPDLPDFCRTTLTNLRAVVDSLYQFGPLSQSERDAIVTSLGIYGQEEAFTVIPSQGCSIHLHNGTAELLAKSSGLECLCERFIVSIDRRVVDECQIEVNQRRPILDETVQWLDSLIDSISRGIDSGLFAPVPLFSEERCSDNDVSSTACLLDVAAACGKTQDDNFLNAIWCDDRSMQRATIKREYLVLGTFEILKGLLAAHAIDKEQYYAHLLQLRAGRVLFLPIDPDEILYHLDKSRVTDGKIVETRELAVLRRYAATCLCQEEVLIRPAETLRSVLDRGEIDIVLKSGQVPGQAIAWIWNVTPYDHATCVARSEWVLTNLYVSSMGALTASGFRRNVHDSDHFEQLDVLSFLINALWVSERANNGHKPRRDYLQWVYERLLRKRFRAYPALLDKVVSSLVDDSRGRGAFLKAPDEKAKDSGLAPPAENEVDYEFAWRALQQRLFDDLPEPVKSGFSKYEDYLDKIGVVVQLHIESKTYKSDDFYCAAARVVNGMRCECQTTDCDVPDKFVPSENEDPNVPFLILRSETIIPVTDPAFLLFHESKERVREVLEGHRSWFECSDEVFASELESICSMESAKERFETVIEWREAATEAFYALLRRQLEDTQGFDLQRLAPGKPECVLYHYAGRYPQNNETRLSECRDAAIADRIACDGFERAFFTAAALPISLPNVIVSHFRSMDDVTQAAVLSSLERQELSPLIRIHLVYLALNAEGVSGQDIARRHITYLLSKEGHVEILALLSLMRWVAANMDFWSGLREWSTIDRLVILWAHTNELLRVLISVGAPVQWINDTFSHVETQASPNLFGSGSWRYDIGNPRNLTHEAFLLPGLSYAVGSSGILRDEDRAAALKIAFEMLEGGAENSFWKPGLLRDPKQNGNALNSFLCVDRGLMMAALGDGQAEGESLSARLKENVCRAVAKLEEYPEDHLSWLQIVATLGDSPPYEEVREALAALVGKIDLRKVIAADKREAGIVLMGIACTVLHMTDPESQNRIGDGIVDAAGQICRGEVGRESDSEGTESFPLILEVLFNIALAQKDIVRRADAFAGTVARLQKTSGQKTRVIAAIAERMTEELPPILAEQFWRVRILERTMSCNHATPTNGGTSE